jgi:hypothetical protein
MPWRQFPSRYRLNGLKCVQLEHPCSLPARARVNLFYLTRSLWKETMTDLIWFELVLGGSESTVCTLRYVTIVLTREGDWQPLHMNMMIREQNGSFLPSLPPPFAEQILSELYLQTNKELTNLYISL